MKIIERKPIRRILPTIFSIFANFFKVIELQEPAFKQLIIVYRRASPPSSPVSSSSSSSPPPSGKESSESKRPPSKKDRAIHIKSFWNIPMADTEVVFPEKKIYVKKLDLIQLFVMVVLALVAVYAKILEGGDFGKLFFIVISLLGLRAFQTWQAMQIARQRISDLMTSTLYLKSMDSQIGVLFYLMDAMEEQEQKEVMIAYSLLSQNPQGLTKLELDETCELFLKNEYDADVDFEIDDSLKKLETEKLVEKKEDKYFAVPLKDALTRLDHKWDNYFQFSIKS